MSVQNKQKKYSKKNQILQRSKSEDLLNQPLIYGIPVAFLEAINIEQAQIGRQIRKTYIFSNLFTNNTLRVNEDDFDQNNSFHQQLKQDAQLKTKTNKFIETYTQKQRSVEESDLLSKSEAKAPKNETLPEQSSQELQSNSQDSELLKQKESLQQSEQVQNQNSKSQQKNSKRRKRNTTEDSNTKGAPLTQIKKNFMTSEEAINFLKNKLDFCNKRLRLKEFQTTQETLSEINEESREESQVDQFLLTTNHNVVDDNDIYFRNSDDKLLTQQVKRLKMKDQDQEEHFFSLSKEKHHKQRHSLQQNLLQKFNTTNQGRSFLAQSQTSYTFQFKRLSI